MSAEEELKQLKESNTKRDKMLQRKARLQAIVLGLGAVITILSMFYGFTQSIETGRQREVAELQKSISVQCERTLEEANANLQRALTEAQNARAEAEKQYQLAQEAAKAKSKK